MCTHFHAKCAHHTSSQYSKQRTAALPDGSSYSVVRLNMNTQAYTLCTCNSSTHEGINKRLLETTYFYLTTPHEGLHQHRSHLIGTYILAAYLTAPQAQCPDVQGCRLHCCATRVAAASKHETLMTHDRRKDRGLVSIKISFINSSPALLTDDFSVQPRTHSHRRRSTNARGRQPIPQPYTL